MLEENALERAHEDALEGKSPSTQAGEFVREEIEHVREGKHGARNTKQAIAIGLSKARRAGINLPPPGKGSSSRVRKKAAQDRRRSRSGRARSRTRSRATSRALKREPGSSASTSVLSRQARTAARRRGSASRRRAARKAVRTSRRSRGSS